MRATLARSLPAAIGFIASTALASLTPARSSFEARHDRGLPAVLAIQSHLEEVERQLRAYPPAGLSPRQSAARAARLEDLRAYRLRGDFPLNLDFPDRVIPYFIDARGVACAVGHLMLLSGGAALALEISRTRNHVYIPEVDDPRLDEWASRNGLTLEECARIQPSYVPHYSDILSVSFDSRNQPWVMTGNLINAYLLSFLGEPGWNTLPLRYPLDHFKLCTVGENPLVAQGTGFYWKGGEQTRPEGGTLQVTTCAGSRDGASFWIGSNRGARRYTVAEGSAPRLADSIRAETDGLPGDTVLHLAVAGKRIWVATSRGLAHRSEGEAWIRVEYPTLGGKGPGGMRAGEGEGIWMGVLANDPRDWWDERYQPATHTGLHWLDGRGNVNRYHRGNSPLPSDTLNAIAPAPGNGVWMIQGRKLLRFTPPDRLTTVIEILPSGSSLLETDAQGRLHLGTYGSGLHRLDGDSLVPLGHPSQPANLAQPKTSESRQSAGWRTLLGPVSHGQFRLDLLGRRVDPSR